MSWLPAEFEALQEAAWLGHLERVRQLLDGGADPNTHPGMPRGWSPLMYAAHKGRLDVVRLLLDRGADANFACGDFFTSLTLAAGADHWEVVKLLAERGGDLAHVDASGVSGLGAAERTGNADLVDSLRRIAARPRDADKGDIQA